MLANVFANITKMTDNISDILDEKINECKIEEPLSNPTEFKLPIDYLDQSERFALNETVCSDLELLSKDEPENIDMNKKKTMYHYLFNPTNEFALNTIPKWRTSITTNTDFLGETQEVIKSMQYHKKTLECTQYKPEYETIMQIWKDTKEDPSFLERYSYMEFKVLRSLNKMPSFLQAISVVNMGSPILSFLIPFVLFLFPFIILKIQGVPITFSVYLSVLKDISKNHFIGKLIANAQTMSLQNIMYIFVLLGLYAYQIYQNYMACIKFYKNINRINTQICEMQSYLNYSITSMECFSYLIKDKKTYGRFNEDILKHLYYLKDLRTRISNVRPFEPSFSKISEIGLLLGCYYEIYSSNDYGAALKYSFDFEGFVNNLQGISDNFLREKVGIADFYDATDLSGNALQMKDQFYPALIDEIYITNDATLDKNMIITGPNAAGKTTFLKTTVINVIFTQQFGCGFYSACKMKPYTHIHSYLNIPDTSGRDSLFQAESRRCKEIIDVILDSDSGSRHFSILDELYSGTNPSEATKSAYSFLLYLSKFENVDFILTTHYVDICERLVKASARIANWKMDANMDDNGDIEYKYTISEGISTIQGAVKVLRDMEYPEEIINNILYYDNKNTNTENLVSESELELELELELE
jgi:hypothetical protein